MLLLSFISLLTLAGTIGLFLEVRSLVNRYHGKKKQKWYLDENGTLNVYLLFALLSILMGVSSFIWQFMLNDITKLVDDTVPMAVWGQIGDFVGGIGGTLFSLGGFFLLYLSFKTQSETLKSQSASSEKASIESRFFELIRLHKENVNELEYSDNTTDKVTKGRKVFSFIYKQNKECYEEISPFFVDKTAEDIYQPGYYHEAVKYQLERNRICLVQLAHLDISYSIVFLGTAFDDLQVLLRIFQKFYKEEFIRKIALYISWKPLDKTRRKDWDNLRGKDVYVVVEGMLRLMSPVTRLQADDFDLLELEPKLKLWKYYGGHQFKLGHYFRHLFQAVEFINKQGSLSYDEKYGYIKTLRAQLSTVEQYLFFFNSLSVFGRAWEYKSLQVDRPRGAQEWMVTKYNLIKNLPDLYLFNSVQINDFYPDVDYELSALGNNRGALKSLWRN